MREIAFRMWNPEMKAFHTMRITPSIFEIQKQLPVASLYATKYDDGGLDWQQYTGLRDKNGVGVEAYEDDVIQRRDGKRGRIIWHQESCGFATAFGDDEPLGSLSSWFEVIGNIYENPELLETAA